MRSDIAISVKNLTKTYRIFGHPGDRIKQALTFGQKQFHKEFTALKDVSFEIKKGETVGIIGRNGSGKSTLLQLICEILKPTSGSVEVNGRISALLELGAGFNPEFTGRENVYFTGALMQFSKSEMDTRIDDIVAFADIGDFFDQPVRTYSSGMFVRLAFAVAIHVDPDILVVDEALAVGDVRFQSKCFRRLEILKNCGTTILMVSHATEQITRLCDSVLLLDQGQVVATGEAGTVVSQFLNLLFAGSALNARRDSTHADGTIADFNSHGLKEFFHARPAYNPYEYRWGNGNAVILDFLLRAGGSDHVSHVGCDKKNITVQLKIFFKHDVICPVFGLIVKSKDGLTLCGVNTVGQVGLSVPRKANDVIFVEFLLSPHLEPGDYFISVGVVDNIGEDVTPLDRRYDSIYLRVTGQTRQIGVINMMPLISITGITQHIACQVEQGLR